MSFKEETEFNMLPASGQKRLKEHIYSAGGIDVLKMAAIYGANGAGKSNLVKAVAAMKNIILNNNYSGISRFKLDKANISKPTSFEIEFTVNDTTYNYGLSVDTNSILEESLYQTGPHNQNLIFERKTQGGITKIQMSDKYSDSPEDKMRIKLYETEFLKENLSLLSVMANAKELFPEIKSIFLFIHIRLIIWNSEEVAPYLNWIFVKTPKSMDFVNENLKTLNLGISNLEFDTTDIETYFGDNTRGIQEVMRMFSEGKEAVMLQPDYFYSPCAINENGKIKIKSAITFQKDIDGLDVKFDLEEQSDGTQKLIEILPGMAAIMNEQNTLIIDEIESHIHVNLLKELISKFSKDNNTNGQLIFTTHESNLLDQDILRQDEIWFAEKSPAGETGFYPLSDYEIRSDLDIRKGYLNGRFGAVPFLANLHDLNWDKYAKDEA
jgi:AAA15 family ATPase/GTPase